MIDHVEDCLPTKERHPTSHDEPAPPEARPRPANSPYAIIWRDGEEIELY